MLQIVISIFYYGLAVGVLTSLVVEFRDAGKYIGSADDQFGGRHRE